jgi:fructose-1,6-bisphosphatase/inositol monophosphatase family enzyme
LRFVRAELILGIFADLVAEVADALSDLDDWGNSGQRPDQYMHDVVADKILSEGLLAAGFRVLSEESGVTGDGDILVVVDPVDGSTNASRALPWYATSLCAVDDRGPVVADVANLATGDRFRAVRGAGAEADHTILRPTDCTELDQSILAFAGVPPAHGGWSQFRCYGASALDLCGVAAGTFDGFVDISRAHAVWDYAGALLVCHEMGVPVVDGLGRDLMVLDPEERRAPVAASTPELLEQLVVMQADW